MFCAVSLSLFGSETHQKDLRFAAVHYALTHFDHYLKMVRYTQNLNTNNFKNIIQLTAEIKTLEDAQQFLATVLSNDEMFDHHLNGTISDIIDFTLQMEIMSTSKIGCYSGKKGSYIDVTI